MLHKLLRHTIVLALILAMPAVMNPAWSASSPATLMGRVLGEDARTPVVGAVVKIQAGDGDILSSEPTTPDGTFGLRDLTPGDYRVIVETNEGAYEVQGNLALEADTTRLVQLSVRKDAAARASAGGAGVASGGGGGGGARAYAPLIGFAAVIGVGLLGSSGGDEPQQRSDSGGVSPSVPGE